MIGTVGVLLAYSAILVCGLIIAKNAKDKFGPLGFLLFWTAVPFLFMVS